MNPTYKIFGKERREVKKQLNELKSYVKNFWHVYDCEEVYGSVSMDKVQANIHLDEIKEQIKKLETKLSIKNDRKEKLTRILK